MSMTNVHSKPFIDTRKYWYQGNMVHLCGQRKMLENLAYTTASALRKYILQQSSSPQTWSLSRFTAPL